MVQVVVARHPLHGRQCAALAVIADSDGPVEQWSPMITQWERTGYTVEIGIATVGAPAAYHSPVLAEPNLRFGRRPDWDTIDAGDSGTLVWCSVGPQHQDCRSWVGTTATGRPVATVTDLGLLDLDPQHQPLPWD